MIKRESVARQIPPGWGLMIWDDLAHDPRAVVVLCQAVDDESQYVTWKVNTIEGGSYLGHYFHDEQKAQSNYMQRRPFR